MFRYTALGDSITYGQDASSSVLAYPRLTAAKARAAGGRASAVVLARSGWTSRDLADTVVDDPSPLHGSSAVSIWIGGNDLVMTGLAYLNSPNIALFQAAVIRYERNLQVILHVIARFRPARIVCCTQYNPFPQSTEAAAGISQLNGATLRAAKRAGVRVAPVHTWFAGREAGLIHGYRTGRLEEAISGKAPIHPNDDGHRLIAENLFPYVYKS